MEWKEVDICQLCDSVSETYKGNASEVVLINTSDVLDGKCLNHEYVLNKKLKGQFKKTFRKGDILYSEIRPANKRFCFVDFEPKDYIASTKLMVLRAHEDVDPQYLYQILRSNDTLAQLQMLAESRSGTFPQITYSELSNIMVSLPSQKAQKNIVSILSSLDRKIELNNKINADLEEMAQAIFKNWFVDFEPFKDGKFVDSELGMIPEGWKVGKITDIGCLITDYVSNGSFASLKQNVHLYETKEYAQFIRNTDLKTNTFSVYVDKHSYDFLSKSTLYGNEIIISNVGDVGSVHLCPKLDIPMTLGNNIIMLRPNEKEYNYFLYLWFKYFSGQGLIQGIKGGSAQPKFNKTDFKNLPMLIPSFEIIERSYWIFESMFSILSSNVKENSRLSTLRDTLLPRLMSGELEVPE